MTDEPRLEEQALSQAVEMGLSSRLDDVENINVDVQTDLLKMAQGKANSVSVEGRGLAMQKDIRVQEMELHADNIAINLFDAIFGQIKLNHPVDATARVVLTEQDINRALGSDYIRSKFKTMELNADGQLVTLEPLQIEIHLPSDGKMEFSGQMLLHDVDKARQIGFAAVIRPRTSSTPILLEGFSCNPGEGISLELTIALMEKLGELANLPYFDLQEFDLQGMAIRIKEMDVQAGSLTLYTEAYIKQIPNQ
ncbi:MAG: DUF2993 domain-containing protein [Cyanobacteriota bacterium]